MRGIAFAVIAIASGSASAASPYDEAFSKAVVACSFPAVWMHDGYNFAWPAEGSYLPVPAVLQASLPFASAEGVQYLEQKVASYSMSARGHIAHSCAYQLLANASAMVARVP